MLLVVHSNSTSRYFLRVSLILHTVLGYIICSYSYIAIYSFSSFCIHVHVLMYIYCIRAHNCVYVCMCVHTCTCYDCSTKNCKILGKYFVISLLTSTLVVIISYE